jgi:CelD/BcsL family acetyltransferase involved in cellulose biosynthesis
MRQLDLEVLESTQALADIDPAWRELWCRDPAATPFHSPDWLLPWTRHLWGGGRMRTLALFMDSRLVALAPLFFWGYNRQPESICISFLGSGITDYLGMIAEPEFATTAARSVFDWLAKQRRDWDVCDLQELRGGSPLLMCEAPGDLRPEIEECSACPVAAAPVSMEELEARLPGAFRHNLHTAENRLHKEGDFAFVRDAPDELIPALFRLHETRWREREEAGMFGTDSLRAFHCESIRALMRSGVARLHGLRVAGQIVAVQYNLLARAVCYLYLSGFDPRFAKFSPGMLLLRESIRCAIEEGARELDFLRHREQFKYRWGAADRVNYTLRITPASA